MNIEEALKEKNYSKITIEDLNFNHRTYLFLSNLGIHTLEELLITDKDDLKAKGAKKCSIEEHYNQIILKIHSLNLLTKNETYIKEKIKQKELKEIKIESLEFSDRILTLLKKENINTLEELLSKSAEELKEIESLGKTSYSEIIRKLKLLGLTLETIKEEEKIIDNSNYNLEKRRLSKKLSQLLKEREKLSQRINLISIEIEETTKKIENTKINYKK